MAKVARDRSPVLVRVDRTEGMRDAAEARHENDHPAPDFGPARRVGCALGSPTRQLPLAIPRGSGSDLGSPGTGAFLLARAPRLAYGLDAITISGRLGHGSLAIARCVSGRPFVAHRARTDDDDELGSGPGRFGPVLRSTPLVGCRCAFSGLVGKPMNGLSSGRMAEWLKAPVLKTGRGLRSLVGSNPTPSASPRVRPRSQSFIIVH
jgi:hypothetical protein